MNKMKKLFLCLLAMTMVLGLFAGCGAQAPVKDLTLTEASETQASTQEAQSLTAQQEITVSTVDEFLAALGSDVCITLAPGSYDLTTASDYGKETAGQAYVWTPCYDGYQLELQDLHNLTIRADGKDTTDLLTVPRTVNVLLLNRCTRILLEGFTAGHTESGEMCNGGVIRLQDCEDAELLGLGLYGCGTIGVDVSGMENLTVSDCEIYDCSAAGIRTDNLSDMTVENCQFHDIGTADNQASSLLMLNSSTGVTVTGCVLQNNISMTLLNVVDADARIENCQFVDNRAVEAGFSFSGSEPILAENNLVGTKLRRWYAEGSDQAVNDEGSPITEEFLPAVTTFAPVADGKGGDQNILRVTDNQDLPLREQIHVATADEFLAALGSDREIILDAELYDLSLASDYGTGSNSVYAWVEEFDGPELVITGISNLVISSNDGKREGHTISATPRYADVLTFRRCENIQLEGFTAGHTKEPGSCAGGVTYFDDCSNITVDNCGLFGCGIIGVQAQYCSNVQVLNCDIYDCSVGGIRMDDVQGAVIDNCTLRNLEYYDINLQNCPDALVNGAPYAP